MCKSRRSYSSSLSYIANQPRPAPLAIQAITTYDEIVLHSHTLIDSYLSAHKGYIFPGFPAADPLLVQTVLLAGVGVVLALKVYDQDKPSSALYERHTSPKPILRIDTSLPPSGRSEQEDFHYTLETSLIKVDRYCRRLIAEGEEKNMSIPNHIYMRYRHSYAMGSRTGWKVLYDQWSEEDQKDFLDYNFKDIAALFPGDLVACQKEYRERYWAQQRVEEARKAFERERKEYRDSVRVPESPVPQYTIRAGARKINFKGDKEFGQEHLEYASTSNAIEGLPNHKPYKPEGMRNDDVPMIRTPRSAGRPRSRERAVEVKIDPFPMTMAKPEGEYFEVCLDKTIAAIQARPDLSTMNTPDCPTGIVHAPKRPERPTEQQVSAAMQVAMDYEDDLPLMECIKTIRVNNPPKHMERRSDSVLTLSSGRTFVDHSARTTDPMIHLPERIKEIPTRRPGWIQVDYPTPRQRLADTIKKVSSSTLTERQPKRKVPRAMTTREWVREVKAMNATTNRAQRYQDIYEHARAIRERSKRRKEMEDRLNISYPRAIRPAPTPLQKQNKVQSLVPIAMPSTDSVSSNQTLYDVPLTPVQAPAPAPTRTSSAISLEKYLRESKKSINQVRQRVFKKSPVKPEYQFIENYSLPKTKTVEAGTGKTFRKGRAIKRTNSMIIRSAPYFGKGFEEDKCLVKEAAQLGKTVRSRASSLFKSTKRSDRKQRERLRAEWKADVDQGSITPPKLSPEMISPPLQHLEYCQIDSSPSWGSGQTGTPSWSTIHHKIREVTNDERNAKERRKAMYEQGTARAKLIRDRAEALGAILDERLSKERRVARIKTITGVSFLQNLRANRIVEV